MGKAEKRLQNSRAIDNNSSGHWFKNLMGYSLGV